MSPDEELRSYVRRPERVQACRLAESHADGWALLRLFGPVQRRTVVVSDARAICERELARLARGRTPATSMRIRPFVLGQDRRVYFDPGDWVVLRGQGLEPLIYPDEAFRRTFTEES